MAKFALADDHVLLRNGLACLLKDFGHDVLFEADNGKAFIEKINPTNLPQLVLMDINMPIMDGYQTCQWLKENHPSVKVLALSMYDHETAIIRMLKVGAKGYLLKDSEPAELKTAIATLLSKDFYYSDLVSGKLLHAISRDDNHASAHKPAEIVSAKELEFLQYTCTELTYKEIADRMAVKTRTVDGYRDALFEKLGVKTRVGLAMYAIKNNLGGL